MENDSGRKVENGYEKIETKKMTRRTFVKATASFGAAVAGIPPYNLTGIDKFLKDSQELAIYPFFYRSINKVFQVIDIKFWGCNWDCKWCSNKFHPLNNAKPMTVSTDEAIYVSSLMKLDIKLPTLFVISGGEPLLQESEMFKLIETIKSRTDYTIALETNGHLIDEVLIEKANSVNLDRIEISFRNIDNKWHKQYTGGYSIEPTIDALNLVTEKFDGLIGVSIILFPVINEVNFEKMCSVLHKINPDFVIRLMYPIMGVYGDDELERYSRKVTKLGKIAQRYFYRIFPSPDDINMFLPTEMARYEVKRNTKGEISLTKNSGWMKEGD